MKVGDSLYFRFLPPFDVNNSSGGKITLASNELIRESAYSRDVRMDIYQRFGILDDYEKHVSLNKKILGFRNHQGGYFYVPEDYVYEKEDDSVPYSDAVLMVNIGLMPVAQPFSPLTKEVKDSVKKHLGVNTDDIEVVRISAEVLVPKSESEQINLTRVSVSKSRYGPDAEMEMLRTSLCKAIERVKALEDYIISCQTPCCCPEDPNVNSGSSTSIEGSVYDIDDDDDVDAVNLFTISNGFDDGTGFPSHIEE